MNQAPAHTDFAWVPRVHLCQISLFIALEAAWTSDYNNCIVCLSQCRPVPISCLRSVRERGSGMYVINEIRIARNGKWYANGAEMFRLPIVNLFATHLERDENGGYYIHLGQETHPVVVEDSPFYVIGIDESKEKLTLVFHDRQEMEITEPVKVYFDGDVPYISFKWEKDTKLSRGTYWKLSEKFEHRGDEVYLVP